MPPLHTDDEETRSYDGFDRLTWRVGRAFAVGVPAWGLLFALFGALLIPGAAFVLASMLATIVTWGADRVMYASSRARRVLPLLGIGVLLYWSLVLPFIAGA